MSKSSALKIITGESSDPDWEQLSTAWESSNQSQRQFCRDHGVSYSTFIHHRNKLRLRQRQQKARDEGKLIAVASVAPTPKHSPYRLELPNGIKLSIPEPFNTASLSALLQLLGITTC